MFSKDTDENVYYNIRLVGKEGKDTIARFNETRVEPILDNPSKYELAVVRFSVPSRKIPIMFFRDGDPANGYTPQQKYTITMSFDGVDKTVQLTHVNNEFPTFLYKKPTIWSYGQFMESMNRAFTEVFSEIKAEKPLAPPTMPPFMIFSNLTSRFALYAPTSYDSNGPPTINIYFNSELERLFDAFQMVYDSNQPSTKRWHYIIKDTNTNGTVHNGNPYYIMKQDTSTLYLWNEIQSLQFETNSIPVNPEMLSSQTNIISRVITDFEPISGAPSRDVIQFFPAGPLRYYDLKSESPMKQMDLSITWRDRKGNTYPIYVNEEDPLTIKLKFRKKKKIYQLDIENEDYDY